MWKSVNCDFEKITVIIVSLRMHRGMARPFFSKDRISHFDIFDRHAEDVVSQMKTRFSEGYAVDIQASWYLFHMAALINFS